MAPFSGRTKLTLIAFLAVGVLLAAGCEQPADIPPESEASKAATSEAASMWTEEQKNAYKSMKQTEMGTAPKADGAPDGEGK